MEIIMAAWDISKHNITDLAQNESLFNSCLSKKQDLTKSDFRRNLDTAYRIIKEYQKKLSSKVNIVSEPQEVEGLCQDCGSNKLIKTGTCACCAVCGSSQGCS